MLIHVLPCVSHRSLDKNLFSGTLPASVSSLNFLSYLCVTMVTVTKYLVILAVVVAVA